MFPNRYSLEIEMRKAFLPKLGLLNDSALSAWLHFEWDPEIQAEVHSEWLKRGHLVC